jgi:hypothetical protein
MGTDREAIRVTNSGRSRVVADIRRAGFSLDLRGRPKIVQGGARSARRWIAVRPGRLTLGPGKSASLAIASKVPAGAEPGDHDALLLLTTRPRLHSGVAVRMRMGIVVDVRAPGTVVRRLVLRRLRVVSRARTRVLELLVANRGNVTESLASSRVRVSLSRHGRFLASLRTGERELLPRSRGVLQFRYRGAVRGWVTARTELESDFDGSVTWRTFRIRL